MKQGLIKSFLLASRPKTLLAAFVPVVTGSAVAYYDNKFSLFPAIVALFCALLIQVGTNFINDLYDYLNGTDNEKRTGPERALAQGWVTVKQMKVAIAVVFAITFIAGLYLVKIAGVSILVVGIFSMLFGYAYTAGPYPLAYNGLGDIFVFLFFGVVGTVGTYYVQALELSPIAFICSVPVGLLISNILVVNNYRDIEGDKESGKITLAVMLGKKGTELQYIFSIFISFMVPIVLAEITGKYELVIPLVLLPIAIKNIKELKLKSGKDLNKVLAGTAALSFLFSIFLSIGFVI